MKKRMLSLPLSAWFLLALSACGGGSAPTFDLHTETAYTHIDGLYVDTDYQDPEGQDRHMLYLCYTVYTPDQRWGRGRPTPQSTTPASAV